MSEILAMAVSGRGLVDPREPVVRADDDGFARGRAVFETLRVYHGWPFRFEQHLARLAQSAEQIGLPPPDTDELTELALQAVDAGLLADAVLRLYWTPGPDGEQPLGIAMVSEIPRWIEPARARGLRVVLLYAPRRAVPWLLPGVKSTSYAVNMAAELQAKQAGMDDAVFVDEEAVVLEGTVTNVWWRYGRRLFTPSTELGILAGETRAAVIQLAKRLGYTAEEGVYLVQHLAEADEVFLTSSVREVMPVVELDRHPFARGPAADALQEALREHAASSARQLSR